MKRYQIRLPDGVSAWLDKLAETKECSRSAVVQDLVTREWQRHLKREERKRQ